MVWLAATVCGAMLAERLSKRQKSLEQLLAFFRLVRLEVTHYLLPFPEVILRISDSFSVHDLGFVSSCAEMLKNGKDFPVAWEESLVRFPLCIGNDETNLIMQFGKTVCSCDINGVEDVLDYYFERFESALTYAVSAKERYAKLFLLSGVFFGGIVFMIII